MYFLVSCFPERASRCIMISFSLSLSLSLSLFSFSLLWQIGTLAGELLERNSFSRPVSHSPVHIPRTFAKKFPPRFRREDEIFSFSTRSGFPLHGAFFAAAVHAFASLRRFYAARNEPARWDSSHRWDASCACTSIVCLYLDFSVAILNPFFETPRFRIRWKRRETKVSPIESARVPGCLGASVQISCPLPNGRYVPKEKKYDEKGKSCEKSNTPILSYG